MKKLLSVLAPPFLLVALVSGHMWFLLDRCAPTYSAADANGYFAQAALIANEGRTSLEPQTPLAYVGLHWLETPDGRFFSRYPPGLAVLLAIPYKLFGPAAGVYLNPILASLTVLMLFLLCRPWVGRWFALLAAALFAAHPLANQQALWAAAHTSTGFFLVTGLFLLDSWARRPHLVKAFAGGFLLGIAPTIRYAEVLAGIGAALFLIVHVIRMRKRYADLLFALGGAAIPIGLLLAHNAVAFGSPFDTGYALTGEQQAGTGFKWEFFADKWSPYVEDLMGPLAGMCFAFGLAGLAAMLVRRVTRPLALGICGIIFPVSIAYMSYYFGSGTNNFGHRFFLTTLPLYFLPALWFVREHVRGAGARAALVALVALQLGVWVPKSLSGTRDEFEKADRMATAVSWIEENVPPGSVIIGERRLHETLQYYHGWKLVDSSLLGGGFSWFGGGGRGNRRGRGRAAGSAEPGQAPTRASPMQRGKAAKLRKRYEGLSREERALRIVEDLYAWAGKGSRIYWIGSSRSIARSVRRFEGDLCGAEDFERVASIELPKPRPRPRRTGGMFGGMGRGLQGLMNRFDPFSLGTEPLEVYKIAQ